MKKGKILIYDCDEKNASISTKIRNNSPFFCYISVCGVMRTIYVFDEDGVNEKSQKKILITGGSGFIGKNLSEFLSQEYQVVSPASKVLNLCNQLQVEEYLKKNKIDIVIHAANYRGKKKEPYNEYKVLENGLRMYANLERCSHLYGKMYYFGSGAEYDNRFNTFDAGDTT